jgi:[protein-PII] uridylyltransferase
VAVVALGGYGREVLCPASDIDLMILHGERRAARIQEAAERLFYPFWDAGLALGHAVRTVDQCVAGARERLDVACSLLDARLVWGHQPLVHELESALIRALRRDPGGFLDALRSDAATRHGSYASCAVSLEPDLKEGSGGMRDANAVAWTVRVVGDGDPVRAGLIRERERETLADAQEYLVRLRSALHLETGGRRDRLYLEHQPALAEAFGFQTSPGLTAIDALMRSLFGHSRHVEHVRDLIFDRAAAPVSGRRKPEVEAATPTSPEEVMVTFARAAATGTPIAPAALDALEAADLGPAPFTWTDGARRAFLDLLATGERGRRALEALDRAELLTRFIPEWEGVRCRPQRDPYHRFTVDVHLLETAAGVAAALAGTGEEDSVLEAAVAGVRDRDALLLGALLHDIGKTGEGRHVETGERIAAAVLERIGVEGPAADTVRFLVREHLLLSNTATRRDLSDQNLVLDVAALVADPERLAMLYILTIGDAAATGPHARTPWRLALVRELVGKVEHVLEAGDMGPDRAALLEERLDEVRTLLGVEAKGPVDAYLARLPRPYLLAVEPGAVASHFRLVGPPIGAAEVRTAAEPGTRPETYDLTVVAADRPGLLAKIAGALALAGLNILTAQAFTTEDGVAIDLFVVETAFEGEADEDRWRKLRHTLRRALEGRLSLEYRVAEKRRHYPAARTEIPVEVRVLDDASDFFTVVEVEAADRIGLLFDVARTLHDLALDVHLAKVATEGHRVIDAFYVRDLYGRKVEDPEHAGEIERAIVARLVGQPG